MEVGWRRIALAAVCSLAVGPLITGCSPGSAAAGFQNPNDDNIPGAGDNPPKNADEAATLTATYSVSVGLHVVDKRGYVLYGYSRDNANPPRANCVGECLLTWKPVEADDKDITTRRVSQRMVSKTQRPDGKWQLTLGGKPVYRYIGDKQPGAFGGQGAENGLWYAMGPTGQPAQVDPNSDTTGFTQTQWGPLSPADRDLLNKVRQAGAWEGPAGRMAAERGASPRVRQIGAEIARQHGRLDAATRDIAAKLGHGLPSTPTPQQNGWLTEMANAKNGQDFDRIFVNRLRLAHGKIFPLIGAVRGATQNTLMRTFAQTGAKFVNDHMLFLESTGLVRTEDLPPAPPVAPPPAPPPGR